jgi:hypothetical protein
MYRGIDVFMHVTRFTFDRLIVGVLGPSISMGDPWVYCSVTSFTQPVLDSMGRSSTNVFAGLYDGNRSPGTMHRCQPRATGSVRRHRVPYYPGPHGRVDAERIDPAERRMEGIIPRHGDSLLPASATVSAAVFPLVCPAPTKISHPQGTRSTLMETLVRSPEVRGTRTDVRWVRVQGGRSERGTANTGTVEEKKKKNIADRQARGGKDEGTHFFLCRSEVPDTVFFFFGQRVARRAMGPRRGLGGKEGGGGGTWEREGPDVAAVACKGGKGEEIIERNKENDHGTRQEGGPIAVMFYSVTRDRLPRATATGPFLGSAAESDGKRFFSDLGWMGHAALGEGSVVFARAYRWCVCPPPPHCGVCVAFPWW